MTELEPKRILRRLGQGEPIDRICADTGMSRPQFEAFWKEQCRRRLPPRTGTTGVGGLKGNARITRDTRGVPHIEATGDLDLFFALGYAVAQDRLFQLEYLRRKAQGRLAELMGPEALDSDVLFRTLDLRRLAERETTTFTPETWELAGAYCRGINAWMEQAAANLPIEFDLLDHTPAPWTITDSLAIVNEFRWYLTVRFPVIAIPELVKRAVGEGALYREFTTGEADHESILQAGEYPAGVRWRGDTGGTTGGDAAGGSNNWTLAGRRTTTGKPLVSSDPHIPYYAVSIWHEVHLRGGSFNVAGVALAGMPAVMIGRSERVAWGITNNICSQRDLYQEKTDAAHPGCYLYDGRWEPARERQEDIFVREPDGGLRRVRKNVRSSRNGPIVDELLPAAAKGTGPVSLCWAGFEPCGWLRAMLDMNRARDCRSFRDAARPWVVPTFNLVFGDVDGTIGFQSVGRIPLRKKRERGYRPGWEPGQEWQGYIPFEEMPHVTNPARGFVVTANNRVAGDDFPYPLAGCWATGYRHGRIRERILAHDKWSREDCGKLQLDTQSGRAAFCVPGLLRELQKDDDPRIKRALARLSDWDFRIDADSVPATLFEAFFQQWLLAVAGERVPADQAAFVATLSGGVACRLLHEDPHGWFKKTPRGQAIRSGLVAALDDLTKRLGLDLDRWTWGRLHTLLQKHYLSGRGDLGALMDLSGLAVGGDGTTVNAGSFDSEYRSYLGVGYRMVADLADPRAGMWSIEVAGASGQPESPNYADQMQPWHQGRLYYLPLQGEVEGDALTLAPV